MKVAFLDRDGTLIFEPPETHQIDSVAQLKILPGVVEGLRRLVKEQYRLVMVTNQDGLGTPALPKNSFEKPQRKLLSLLKQDGIEFYKIFICPHLEKTRCACRKPKPGLVKKFLASEKIDYEKSFAVGDRATDMEFAENIGIRGYLMDTNQRFPRIASVERSTKETNVFVQCNLDGRGMSWIQSGINFLNHMLEQLAKHSLMDLKIQAKGDLQVDEHHTVEDIALVLGETLGAALGSRKGIRRFGFTVPLDDALAEVTLDLGGRPYLVFNGKFTRDRVGDLPTELIEHFFHSLANSLKANLHINLRYGENEHHKTEAIFKALANVLRMACAIDPRAKNAVPSTKDLI